MLTRLDLLKTASAVGVALVITAGCSNKIHVKSAVNDKSAVNSVELNSLQAVEGNWTQPNAKPLLADDISAKVTFDYAWQTLNDNYPHFESRGINWQQLYKKYSLQIQPNSTNEQLQKTLAKLIGELADANVVLDTGEARFSGAKKVPLQQAAKAMAANAHAFGEALDETQALEKLKSTYLSIQKSYVTEQSWQQWPKDSQNPSIAWGLSEKNVGLLVLNKLDHLADAPQALLTSVMADLNDSDGLILDLRNNIGTNQSIATAIAERFTSTSADTFVTLVNNARVQNDEQKVYQVQGNNTAYKKSTYVIISQGTVGATERLAVVLGSQSHVKIVGEPSAGALSNSIEMVLPNKWRLFLPNTVVKDAKGITLSSVGIQPDIYAPAYSQASTRQLKFESYQRALTDMGKFQHANIPVEDYESKMQQLMSEGLIPGAAMAVVKGGEIVYSQGFGRADENGHSVTADTPFFIASISKTLLGTTIAQAQANGLLSLKDKVEGAQNVLGFDISYPQNPDFKPTFAQLLTHTSGLVDDRITGLCTYYFVDDFASVANWHFGEPKCPDTINPSLGNHLQQYLNEQGTLYKPSNFTSSYDVAPGSVSRYSNYGAALAGFALEAKTGKSLVELTNQYVIKPLGLTNTRWSVQGIKGNTARRYIVNADGIATPLREYLSVTYPDGGAISSANDLAKYLAVASNGGVFQGEQLLNADGIANMLTSQSTVPTVERGTGYFWHLDGDYFSHNGGDFGVLADVWADTHHDIGVVLLTNGDIFHGPAITSMIEMFATSKAFAYGYSEQ